MNQGLFRFEEISVRGLCMELFRNLWMVFLIGAALWLGSTGLHKLTYKPQYTSYSTLVVTLKGQDSTYSSLSIAKQMADVFGMVFQSEVLREKIIEDTGEDIQGTIDCQPVNETNLLVLSSTSQNPRQAYLFIHSALKHYEEVAKDVFANAVLQVVQEPEVPSAPSNTSFFMARRSLITGAGVIVMAAIIALFYILRFTVKNLTSARRLLDGKIRGMIPYEHKRMSANKKWVKKALLLNSPSVSMDFAESSRRVEAQIEYHMRRNHQKILLVTSVSENEGKSTVAANIALALAEKHKKVLLVDGDLRKPAQYKVFEEEQTGRDSFNQLLKEKGNWREKIYYNKANQLWELFQFHSVEEPAAVLDGSFLEKLAEEWKSEMDYIIIDCSPVSISTDAEHLMKMADSVVLVVRQDWSDVRVINDTVDMIWQSDCDFSGFILNAFYKEWIQTGYSYGYEGYERG